MKITKSQLKEMVREAIGTVLNKDIVKFTADEIKGRETEEKETNEEAIKGTKRKGES